MSYDSYKAARLSVCLGRERYGVGGRSCGDCDGQRGEQQSVSLVHSRNGVYCVFVY